MTDENNHYDVSKGAWAVYGLVSNGTGGHTLCFLAQTNDPEAVADENEKYAAVCAYDLASMRQFDRDPQPPGIVLVHY